MLGHPSVLRLGDLQDPRGRHGPQHTRGPYRTNVQIAWTRFGPGAGGRRGEGTRLSAAPSTAALPHLMTLSLARFSRRLIVTFASLLLVAAVNPPTPGAQPDDPPWPTSCGARRSPPTSTADGQGEGGGRGHPARRVGWASIEQEAKGNYNQWYLKRLDAVVDKAEARWLLLTFWGRRAGRRPRPRAASRTAPATGGVERSSAGRPRRERLRGGACSWSRATAAGLRPGRSSRTTTTTSRPTTSSAATRRWSAPATWRLARPTPARRSSRPAGRRRLRVHALAARSRRGRHFDAWSVHYSGDRSHRPRPRPSGSRTRSCAACRRCARRCWPPVRTSRSG